MFRKAGQRVGYAEALTQMKQSGYLKKYKFGEVSPVGWSGTVKAMKGHKDITNPWALAWYMHGKGYTPHHAPVKREVQVKTTEVGWSDEARQAAQLARSHGYKSSGKPGKDGMTLAHPKGHIVSVMNNGSWSHSPAGDHPYGGSKPSVDGRGLNKLNSTLIRTKNEPIDSFKGPGSSGVYPSGYGRRGPGGAFESIHIPRITESMVVREAQRILARESG